MSTRVFYRRGKRVEIEQLDDVVAQRNGGRPNRAMPWTPPRCSALASIADDTGSVPCPAT